MALRLTLRSAAAARSAALRAPARAEWRRALSGEAPGQPHHIKVPLPDFDETRRGGKIVSWKKKLGDEVLPGEVLCEVETPDAVVELESKHAGFVVKILAPEGAGVVPVGAEIVELVLTKADMDKEKGEGGPAQPQPSEGGGKSLSAARIPSPLRGRGFATAAVAASGARRPPLTLSPAVLNLVTLHKLDPLAIAGTGPKGRILKGDVLAFLKGAAPLTAERAAAPQPSPPPRPAAAAALGTSAQSSLGRSFVRSHEDVSTASETRAAAARAAHAKQSAPHLYTTVSCDVTPTLEALAAREAGGARPDLAPFVMRAVALALRDVPEANAAWSEAAGAPQRFATVSIAAQSIAAGPRAAAEPASSVVLPRADASPVQAIADALAGRAQPPAAAAAAAAAATASSEGAAPVVAVRGAGLTASSLILQGAHACAFSFGEAALQVVPSEGGALATRHVLHLSLSADRRVVSDEVAERLLASVCAFLAAPKLMLL
jgi:pyruvate dehydrogenase E2 component (dihydrolipoamide acetyltransferase)